jgi:hypothetical protein
VPKDWHDWDVSNPPVALQTRRGRQLLMALDSSSGQKLWHRTLDGAVGGGVITYMANGAQNVAVAYRFTHPE